MLVWFNITSDEKLSSRIIRNSFHLKQHGHHSPPACLKTRQVEKAAQEGFVTCFNGDWNRDLEIVDPGRSEAEGTVERDRETVRGTDRARLRRDSILRVN